MKYLKTFEAKQTIDKVKSKISNFLKKYELYSNNYNGGSYISVMNYYRVPHELEYEFSVLYFLYSDTSNIYAPNWKQLDDTDNYIKRQVKIYIQKLILQQFDKNPEIYFKLKNLFNERKKLGISMPKSAHDKYILFNLETAIKNAPEHLETSSKYNM